MQVDFVAVPAQVPGMCNGCIHFETKPVVDTNCNRVNGVYQKQTCMTSSIMWAKAPAKIHERTVIARANDPATSKGSRKVNKYEQAVLDILKGLYEGQGYTGKQIASLTGHPLNCITPRFAPLRRKGLIKDSGIKRDKQIVWVLV